MVNQVPGRVDLETPDREVYRRIERLATGPDGLRWLQGLDRMQAGPVRFDEAAIADELVALGIGRLVPSGVALTQFGFKCADSAREYLLWIGRRRRFHDEDEYPATRIENFRGKDVLELGSGWGCNVVRIATVARTAVGLEIEPVYLQFSRVLAGRDGFPAPLMAGGAGEAVPFRDRSFDWILLMAALQYTDIDRTLRECSRLLRPGGSIVVGHVPLFRYIRDGFKNALRHGQPRLLIPWAAVVANTLWYELMGRRLLENPGGYATARPVHVSERCLIRAGARAGLAFSRDLSAQTSGQRYLLVLQKPLMAS